jgi:hypothetical protein
LTHDGGAVAFWGPNPYPGAIVINFQFNGIMAVNGGVLGTYAADTWYKIGLKDFKFSTTENNTFDIYVDDTLIYDDRVMSGQPARQLWGHCHL